MWILRTFFVVIILSSLLGCSDDRSLLSGNRGGVQEGWTDAVMVYEYNLCRNTNYRNEDATQSMKACKCWLDRISVSVSHEDAINNQELSQSILRQCLINAGIGF